MLPSSMSSPNGATLTPSLTSSSHNSASPNNSGNTNEDGNLLIDEDPDQIRSDQNDDDSIEDVLKKECEVSQTQTRYLNKESYENASMYTDCYHLHSVSSNGATIKFSKKKELCQKYPV